MANTGPHRTPLTEADLEERGGPKPKAWLVPGSSSTRAEEDEGGPKGSTKGPSLSPPSVLHPRQSPLQESRSSHLTLLAPLLAPSCSASCFFLLRFLLLLAPLLASSCSTPSLTPRKLTISSICTPQPLRTSPTSPETRTFTDFILKNGRTTLSLGPGPHGHPHHS